MVWFVWLQLQNVDVLSVALFEPKHRRAVVPCPKSPSQCLVSVWTTFHY